MDQQQLRQLVHWIAINGMNSYTPGLIAHDLNLDTSIIPPTSSSVLDKVFSNALISAKTITNIQYPKTEDELFDLTLTFFEELTLYKPDFQIIFNKNKISLDYLDFVPIVDKITTTIFYTYRHTFFDKVTYKIIFIKLFYNWINDLTQDLSHTSHQINQISKIISNII
jgi:hypothetical protein